MKKVLICFYQKFFPIYILILPFKLLFGGENSETDNATDDFLDDCDFF